MSSSSTSNHQGQQSSDSSNLSITSQSIHTTSESSLKENNKDNKAESIMFYSKYITHLVNTVPSPQASVADVQNWASHIFKNRGVTKIKPVDLVCTGLELHLTSAGTFENHFCDLGLGRDQAHAVAQDIDEALKRWNHQQARLGLGGSAMPKVDACINILMVFIVASLVVYSITRYGGERKLE